MNVLVTGGSGFIGRRLVDVLARQGHRVRMVSRRVHGTRSTGVHLVNGDLTSMDCSLDRLVGGCEVVFHCAGKVRNEAAMRLLHVDGTQRLLDAVLHEAKQRGQIVHWVQLSSVGVYGPPQGVANSDRVVTEETPTRPLGEYEITKARSDQLVLQASESGFMTYSIVRPSNVFGLDMPNQSLRSLGAMVRKGLFFYIGGPGAVAPYVHVDDVVEVLLRCGIDQRTKGKIFNVSNDCLLEEMINGLAMALGVTRPRMRFPERLVRAVAGVAATIAHAPLTQERINALVARTRYPAVKLEQELGFTPQVSVPSAIGEVVLTY